MYDYRLLEALAAVRDHGGFERAADFLGLTQSAVSQRIRTLEDLEGQILISRHSPHEPTPRGRELIRLCRKVAMLEGDLESRSPKRALRIGLNADSLATWFPLAVDPFLSEGGRFLDLQVDDQVKTREMLRRGEVAGCIGSDNRPLQGCGVRFLGRMDYALVCTIPYKKEWFSRGISPESAGKAPAVIFNREDGLHGRFWERLFPNEPFAVAAHYFPSSEQFLNLILRNRAYGAVPLLQCSSLLGKELIELAEFRIGVDLYWHHWNMDTADMKELTACLADRGGALIY